MSIFFFYFLLKTRNDEAVVRVFPLTLHLLLSQIPVAFGLNMALLVSTTRWQYVARPWL